MSETLPRQRIWSPGPAAGRQLLRALGPALVGCLLGLGAGALLILLAGGNPLAAYQAMLGGAFGGGRQLTDTVLKTVPLLIIGLGLSVAFRAQVWNIGAEGQYACGALAGGAVALYAGTWPAPLLLTAMLLAGLAGGGLWALIPALLRVRRGLSEIFTTLMLNYVAILLLQYMARVPLRDPHGFLPESARLTAAARLPLLFHSRIHLGVLLALALVPAVYVLIWQTPRGFRLRALGISPSVARFAGINVGASVVFALVFSGALAGLAGIIQVSAIDGRLNAGIMANYGFTAILVALLGRLHPLGVLLAAAFFSALTIGAGAMQAQTGLPVTLADAIQAIVVLVMVAVDAYSRLRGDAYG